MSIWPSLVGAAMLFLAAYLYWADKHADYCDARIEWAERCDKAKDLLSDEELVAYNAELDMFFREKFPNAARMCDEMDAKWQKEGYHG
jgi:hypothetical protein